MKIVINACYGGFGISHKFFDYYNIPYKQSLYGNAYCTEEGFDKRKDPRLIEFIEKFGSKEASGSCSRLIIEEIPKGTAFRITEYDGAESIEYRDMCNWEIAD